MTKSFEVVVVRTKGPRPTTGKACPKENPHVRAAPSAHSFWRYEWRASKNLELPQTPLETSDLYTLAATISRTPSLLESRRNPPGTVFAQGNTARSYMEDVGRP